MSKRRQYRRRGMSSDDETEDADQEKSTEDNDTVRLVSATIIERYIK